MPRPTSKNDLMTAAKENYKKLNLLISKMTEEELNTPFDFSKEEKKKEAHWKRDKNLRDVLIHLYEWHQLILNWVHSNQKGEEKPFLPEPYNWKTYGDMNVEFWKKHQNTSLENATKMFHKSHSDVLQLAETFTNEELFSKGVYKWVGGCTHGCIYCDSRSKCYQMNHKFEDVEVKENGISLLEESLKRKRKKCMIGLGSMTDPYIKEELGLNYIRQALEIINKFGFGVTLITKSANVLRELDLLKEINSKAKCVIQMTLTTYDEELCKKIEPNVSTTKERVEALKILRDEGIPTVVWLTPILPFINDTSENTETIM